MFWNWVVSVIFQLSNIPKALSIYCSLIKLSSQFNTGIVLLTNARFPLALCLRDARWVISFLITEEIAGSGINNSSKGQAQGQTLRTHSPQKAQIRVLRDTCHQDPSVAVPVNAPQLDVGLGFDGGSSGGAIDEGELSKAPTLTHTGGPLIVHVNLQGRAWSELPAALCSLGSKREFSHLYWGWSFQGFIKLLPCTICIFTDKGIPFYISCTSTHSTSLYTHRLLRNHISTRSGS